MLADTLTARGRLPGGLGDPAAQGVPRGGGGAPAGGGELLGGPGPGAQELVAVVADLGDAADGAHGLLQLPDPGAGEDRLAAGRAAAGPGHRGRAASCRPPAGPLASTASVVVGREPRDAGGCGEEGPGGRRVGVEGAGCRHEDAAPCGAGELVEQRDRVGDELLGAQDRLRGRGGPGEQRAEASRRRPAAAARCVLRCAAPGVVAGQPAVPSAAAEVTCPASAGTRKSRRRAGLAASRCSRRRPARRRPRGRRASRPRRRAPRTRVRIRDWPGLAPATAARSASVSGSTHGRVPGGRRR